MSNLILIGFKSAGKTTIGKAIAKRINYDFIDTDSFLDLTTYETQDPTLFRMKEKQVIESIKNVTKTVIATGGGSILDPNNVDIFKKMGKLIYLNHSKKDLKRRLLQPPLSALIDPCKPSKSFEEMYKKRAPLYKNIADYTIRNTDKLWQAIHLEHCSALLHGENPMVKLLAWLSMDVLRD